VERRKVSACHQPELQISLSLAIPDICTFRRVTQVVATIFPRLKAEKRLHEPRAIHLMYVLTVHRLKKIDICDWIPILFGAMISSMNIACPRTLSKFTNLAPCHVFVNLVCLNSKLWGTHSYRCKVDVTYGIYDVMLKVR